MIEGARERGTGVWKELKIREWCVDKLDKIVRERED